jgi:hypothetical protein
MENTMSPQNSEIRNNKKSTTDNCNDSSSNNQHPSMEKHQLSTKESLMKAADEKVSFLDWGFPGHLTENEYAVFVS